MEIGKPEKKIRIVPVEEPVPSPIPMPEPAEVPVVEPVVEPGEKCHTHSLRSLPWMPAPPDRSGYSSIRCMACAAAVGLEPTNDLSSEGAHYFRYL